jgi:two-component system, OmpR family, sensor histidine kinase CssS
MKTIRERISKPFLIIICVLPLVTMLLFNFTVTIYMNRNAKRELQNTVDGIEILIKQQLAEGILERSLANNSSALLDDLMSLRSALRLTRLTSNTEFLVVSGKGEVLFPNSYQDSFLNNELVGNALIKLDVANENKIVSLRIGMDKYFATYRSFTNSPAKLVFISYSNSARKLIRFINLLLFGIILLAVGISSMIALRVSKTISLPITRLSNYAKRIGKGEFLSLNRDYSSVEVYELTENMNEMSERLKNHDLTQKNFLQNASHELRTPLMSIQGYAEGIANGVFSDSVHTAQIICEESRRLNTLVEELLTLSRIENRSYKGEFVSLNLSDMVKEYVQKINGYAIKEGKNLQLIIKEDPVAAWIDDSLLAQAVINILSNCIKYAKSEVTVTVYSDGPAAMIKISDDGNGIAPNDLPHIFERFYKGKQGNFGLGLSIAQSAVEYMGGSIRAYNEEGAVFEIRLKS